MAAPEHRLLGADPQVHRSQNCSQPKFRGDCDGVREAAEWGRQQWAPAPQREKGSGSGEPRGEGVSGKRCRRKQHPQLL